jgi:tetratricopeptide (TPR) repeat protein
VLVVNQIGLFLRLFASPLTSFSRILDEGRLLFAVVTAVAVMLSVQLPRSFQVDEEEAAAARLAVKARLERAKALAAAQQGSRSAGEITQDMAADLADDVSPIQGPPSMTRAASRFIGQVPRNYFSPLIALAICFVPAIIFVLTLWDNLGGFSTILFRDYTALLVCVLLAWSAPYLLLAVANFALGAMQFPGYDQPALWWIASLYFTTLSVFAVRTLFGTTFSHAAGAAAAGWGAAVGGMWLSGIFGGMAGYLASPFVLYYLYAGLKPQFSGLGTGLQSRQRLKRGLEIATLNPRDADAHYQLGLIYMQRRQYEPAIRSLRQAAEIAPKEPDAWYQLGRIAREQGRYAEAIELCGTAARLDDKHSSSEVWREIGIANLLSGDAEAARRALAVYVDRRPYDPEGACWYGRALAKLDRGAEARTAFDQAIEAVRTMPPARKRQVQRWESEARRELKKLAA